MKTLIIDSALEITKSKFINILSIHIYCIQPKQNTNLQTISTTIFNEDIQYLLQKYTQELMEANSLRDNRYSCIINDSIIRTRVEETIKLSPIKAPQKSYVPPPVPTAQPKKTNTTNKTNTKPPTKSAGMNSFFGKSSESATPNTATTTTPTTPSPTSPMKKTSSVGKVGTLSNMFSKQVAAKPVEKKIEKTIETPVVKPIVKPVEKKR
jgi:hypothetical protein